MEGRHGDEKDDAADARARIRSACVLFAARPALAEDYVIGAELALTGTYAWVGVPSREGLDVGIEEVNASDLLGGHKLKVLIEDTGSDKTQAISLINRFSARDKALMVLGPSSSSEGVAIAPVANELQIPLLTTTAVSEAINKSGPWVFKTPASPALVIGDVAKYAVNKMGVKSVAMVWGRNNDGQIGQKNAALETFKASNTKIVAEESVLTSDTDFLAVITKIIATKPDAVFLALVAEQSANFIIQARQQGIDPAGEVSRRAEFRIRPVHPDRRKGGRGSCLRCRLFRRERRVRRTSASSKPTAKSTIALPTTARRSATRR